MMVERKDGVVDREEKDKGIVESFVNGFVKFKKEKDKEHISTIIKNLSSSNNASLCWLRDVIDKILEKRSVSSPTKKDNYRGFVCEVCGKYFDEDEGVCYCGGSINERK